MMAQAGRRNELEHEIRNLGQEHAYCSVGYIPCVF